MSDSGKRFGEKLRLPIIHTLTQPYEYKRSSSSRVTFGLCAFRALTGFTTIPFHPSLHSSSILSFVFFAALPGNFESRSINSPTSSTVSFNSGTLRLSWNGEEGPNFFWSFTVAFRRSLDVKQLSSASLKWDLNLPGSIRLLNKLFEPLVINPLQLLLRTLVGVVCESLDAIQAHQNV